MKKRKMSKSIFAILAIAVAMVSCKTEQSREDQVSAIIDNVDSPFFIVNAVPGDLIEKSGAMDGALPFTQEMLLGFFIDEEVTGVDYDVDVQIIVGKGPSFAPNFYGIFKVKNETAFVELLETEANAEVMEREGFKYIIKESDQYVIVWDEEFAIASNIPIDFADMFSGGGSKQGDKAVNKAIQLIKAGYEGEANEEYKAFLQTEADIAMRYEGEGLYAYMSEMSMGDNEELEANKESIEGGNANIYLNFNNGSIGLQAVSELADELKEKFAFLKDEPVNSKLMDYGNSANPIALFSYHANLEKALDYSEDQMSPLEYADFEETLAEVGLTTEDAKNALTGEVLMIMDRVEIVEEVIDWGYGEPYVSEEPVPVFALALGVADAGIVKTVLVDSLMITEGVYKNGDAFMVLSNDVFFTTNDSAWAAKVQAGETQTVTDKTGSIASHPFALYIDFAPLAYMPDLGDAKPVVELVDNFHGGGNIDEINFSLVLKDDSKNALRLITETVSSLTEEAPEGEEFEALEEELEAAAAETAEEETH